MSDRSVDTGTVADAYLALLADRGVDYFFANAGTDFTPLIEAFAKAAALNLPAPKPIAVPHENVAMALAMGYTMVTGRPQMVMVHTNVGTANALCQMLNTNRLNLPVLVAAGRTPFAEDATKGGRSIDIHWTQEMFDQAGMVREAVKWDYELRDAGQLEAVVDRALNIANAMPKGPVYLTLPREVLAREVSNFTYGAFAQHSDATAPFPDLNAIDELAEVIAAAKNPMIVTSQLGNVPDAVDAVSDLAARFAIPVTQYRPRTMNLPSAHPMHAGFNPAPWIAGADVIIAVECEVPWIPRLKKPNDDCKIAHIAADPLYSGAPHRGFRADFAITGAADKSMQALTQALEARLGDGDAGVAERRGRIEAELGQQSQERTARLRDMSMIQPADPAWISHCLNEVIGGDAVVMREAQLDLNYLERSEPRTMFGGASGLGWGLGGAVGAKLAEPERLVVAAEGDGAYMFGNPVSAHFVAAAHDLPFLTVIFNNERWDAVSQATRAMYPEGYAAKSNSEPLSSLKPSPNFEQVVTASDGYGARVEDPAEIPRALETAIKEVTVNKRQAVLNVISA
ncbi:MAG: thiamine pyrophosphate-requiring protein [Rhodospirillaceae bacterium]|jgi:acetolactate synthase I/II/III large subunit|nr:thiamine pyrophosphate-requiring protein [Rhodospirillaceae bacterium]MBT3886473.1 thiamine pyrophosphate-requiring protein [Rhodospirillaceae bacterium]MBT4117936.1 thiamine pyrophosphate-requiring protein [Rhodospirillaceae bacterium]MBT4671590.1 thiamine pyrophosphate-requiring protein [Rhodospirillaceae bacterium]MBT4719814.1 thiamine pyrophosphate-requiring protein [Rhodospirillaceae bacterium]